MSNFTLAVNLFTNVKYLKQFPDLFLSRDLDSINSINDFLNIIYAEKTPRYSRALMETLSIIVYKQPVTRGDIEAIRGVSVSSSIMRTLTDRNWIKIVGYRDVPGKPAMFSTTNEFLDYFVLDSQGMH